MKTKYWRMKRAQERQTWPDANHYQLERWYLLRIVSYSRDCFGVSCGIRKRIAQMVDTTSGKLTIGLLTKTSENIKRLNRKLQYSPSLALS